MEKTAAKWEFRELCSSDIFPVFRIVSKIGFKQFRDCFQSEDVKNMAAKGGKKDVSAIGMTIFFDIAGIVMENISSCENELYDLLSSVSNLSKEDVKKLTLAEFAEMVIDFIKKPDFADFFKVVSKLFN